MSKNEKRVPEYVSLLVIGGGAAGMAAALAAEEAGAPSVLLVEREEELGGVLCQCLHYGFGLGYFRENLNGVEYAQRFRSRVERSGVQVCTGTTVLRLDADRSALLSGRSGLNRVFFEHCILATGCREQTVGALPIAGTRPAGVFTAGAVQRMVNLAGMDVGQEIVILGSGDIGQIMARQLTQQGKHIVAMIEQREEPGGMARNRKECLEAYRIPLILRSTIEEIRGSGRITGVVVRHLDSGEREALNCDTLITALGLIPEREAALSLEENGEFPDWLTLCGNCEHVHSILDGATAQGSAVGALAGLLCREKNIGFRKDERHDGDGPVYVP